MGSIRKTRDKLDRALPIHLDLSKLSWISSLRARKKHTSLSSIDNWSDFPSTDIYYDFKILFERTNNTFLILSLSLSSPPSTCYSKINEIKNHPSPDCIVSSIHPLRGSKKMPRRSSPSSTTDRERERETALTEEIRSIVRGKREEAEGESDPDDGHRLSRLSASIGETRGRKKGRREGRWRVLRGACAADFTHGLARPRYILLSLSPLPSTPP